MTNNIQLLMEILGLNFMEGQIKQINNDPKELAKDVVDFAFNEDEEIEGPILGAFMSELKDSADSKYIAEFLQELVHMVITKYQSEGYAIELIKKGIDKYKISYMKGLLDCFLEEELYLIEETGDSRASFVAICYIINGVKDFKKNAEKYPNPNQLTTLTLNDIAEVIKNILISDNTKEEKKLKLEDLTHHISIPYENKPEELKKILDILRDKVDDLLLDIGKDELIGPRITQGNVSFNATVTEAKEIWKPKFKFEKGGITNEQHAFNLEQIRYMIEDLNDLEMAKRYLVKIMEILKKEFRSGFDKEYLMMISEYAKSRIEGGKK